MEALSPYLHKCASSDVCDRVYRYHAWSALFQGTRSLRPGDTSCITCVNTLIGGLARCFYVTAFYCSSLFTHARVCVLSFALEFVYNHVLR